ncbi:UDP-N-acetylmuramyl-tripeptide synthetase [Lentibacillus sediminis]|uniref:UDP-N-acetylmuramyl-tripeptide synthetase n=1 Tax=Lentibacillus sediminis TaxID=1940529 RepID=UPI000C1C5CC5|nr:UDP-N-acetylmuramyl-tripeptide synthetase [Lentibacillus sediminis]
MIHLKKIIQHHYIASRGSLVLPIEQTSIHSAVPNENGIFFCRSGRLNSLNFVEEAIENGAICVISNEMDVLEKRKVHPDTAFIVVNQLETVITEVLHHLYKNEMEQMSFIGVTGTNGKTTVTHLISSLLNSFYHKSGFVGTEGVLDHQMEDVDYHKTTPTTPEAPELANIIRYFHEKNYQTMAFEATSVALDQKRVGFFPVHIGVFTNFSKDHMDYHGSMEHYLKSKMMLAESAEALVYSLDEPAFQPLSKWQKPALTFSLRNPQANLYATQILFGEKGTSFTLHYHEKRYRIRTSFIGEHNVYNILSACAVLLLMGYKMKAIARKLSSISPLHNRFQIIYVRERRFILDFAHTPVAVEKAMQAARLLTPSRLIAMVNGIGLRGLEKAKLMSESIDTSADFVVMGAEQVGFVDPKKVITAMRKGLDPAIGSNKMDTAESRKEAIRKCIQYSAPGDTILLTGINEPQHEQGELVPHDDLEEIENILASSPYSKIV